MADILQTTRRKMVIALLAVLSLIAVTLSSCVKSSDANPAAPFVGIWNGTSTCGGFAILTFSAGSGNTVTMIDSVGADTCMKHVTYTLTANGNSLTDTVTNTDLCGNIISVGISASINGGTLTYTINTAGGGACVFTGTKQY